VVSGVKLILSHFLPHFVHFLVKRRRQSFVRACSDPKKTQEDLKKRLENFCKRPFPESPTEYTDYVGAKELTKEKVKFFETTSGSSGPKKEIPYTPSLLKSFENMFLLWVDDLMNHSGLRFKSGKFFMSISPTIGEKKVDDRKYLSPMINFVLSPFLVSNPNTHISKTGDEFLLKISKDLVNSPKLEMISVWSPTYLLSLLEFIDTHRNELGLTDLDFKDIWPHLKLISCWTHAQAKIPASRIKTYFPGVMIQGKGLLMTEAPVTIPWSEAKGFVPLLTETLIEFWDGERILGLHEGDLGKTYTLLISQFNGLLRYNTHDKVKVTGLYHKTPLLEFMGREGRCTDLAGEKFSEELLRDLFKEDTGTFFLVPDQREELPRYFILTDKILPFEEKLRTIYHYHLARELNQLKPIVIKITNNPMKIYFEFCQSKGMVLGDIKERILFSELDDANKFLEWIDRENLP
jgi:hypothetical protein